MAGRQFALSRRGLCPDRAHPDSGQTDRQAETTVDERQLGIGRSQRMRDVRLAFAEGHFEKSSPHVTEKHYRLFWYRILCIRLGRLAHR